MRKVEIIKGFYKGRIGKIVNENDTYIFVEIDLNLLSSPIITFKKEKMEEFLKVI